jgi:hemoglobin/transferrin/lactoferrin receptor protein
VSLLGTLLLPTISVGQDASRDEDVTTLPEVEVRDKRELRRAPDVELPSDRPVTTITAEAIERRQADTIFDLLRDTPGVGVNGGPRASGMKFNLRGFSDNEDVLFKIDGAVKGFEKYRFGSGVFIEPELLKAVEVERGPSVKSGSGALGGTVSATTKSAADYLAPGQRIGSTLKYGYNANNAERLRMLTVYGRPSGYLDLVASIALRDSDDIRLPDRSRLSLTATHSESRFAKATVYATDALTVELSQTMYKSGPERTPYDATAGGPGGFGVVERTIEDTTTNLRVNYTPEDSWIALRATLAYEETDLNDVHRSQQSNVCVTPPMFPPSQRVDRCDDHWQYAIWTAEVFNDTHYDFGELKGVLSIGYQGIRNRRDISRIRSGARTDEDISRGGFVAAQPPGNKISDALIVENAFTWRDITITPGARMDRYHVSAMGHTRTMMIQAGQSPDIRFSRVSPAIAMTWRIPDSDWSTTLRYNEAFRPPLIDEYFAAGSESASRCIKTSGRANLPGHPVLDPLPLYDRSGVGLPYDPALDLAPDNGICGALYRPQESSNHELIFAWMPNPVAPTDGRWRARATYYDIHTRNKLDSISNIGGAIGQPGTERRKGTELEISYDGIRWFSSVNWSQITGRIVDPVAGTDYVLYGVPGDTLSISAGFRGFDGRVEAGLRMRDIADRLATEPSQPTDCWRAGSQLVPGLGSNKIRLGTQHGVRLLDLFASMQVTSDTVLRLNVDNITNENYCLPDGFAGSVGIQAPGRSARVSLTMSF